MGALPFAIKPLSEKLAGHDVVLVVGAPVFRYYPYVPGEYLPDGLHLIQSTDEPRLYSVQSLWTAVQLGLPLVVITPQNTEYAILKSFTDFEVTPDVPGLDLPGLDLVTLAQGFGCDAKRVDDPNQITPSVKDALAGGKVSVLAVPATAEVPPLL